MTRYRIVMEIDTNMTREQVNNAAKTWAESAKDSLVYLSTEQVPTSENDCYESLINRR